MNALDFRKRAIMSVINNVKGFERSVSGTSVTLEGCVDDDSIVDYKIYGNCYQDGEPSIDNPIEVQCVGDRTCNVFDYKNVSLWKNPVINSTISRLENGFVCDNKSSQAEYFAIENVGSFLKPNTTYTVSMEVSYVRHQTGGASAGSMEYVWWLQDNLNFSTNTKILAMGKQYKIGHVTTTFTTPENFDTLKYLVTRVTGYCTVTYANICFVEGDTAVDYEPYGYKIPITASGKNLFDKNDYVLEGNYLAFSCKHLKLGKTYTIVTNKQINLFKISDYFSSGTNVSRWNFTTVSFTLTEAVDNLPNKYMYIRFNYADGVINDIAQLDGAQLMIVEGSYTSATIGDYEPYYEPITTNIYLDEPLRGIDSYLDCVGYKDEISERNIAKRFILSSDVGNKSATSTNTWYSYFVQMPSNVVFSVRVLSNIGGNSYNMYMLHRANGDDGGFYANVNTSYFLAFRDLTTKEEIQSYLDNTEVYTYYVIQPIETPITLPKLPTFKGTTIYKVGTSLQPANIEIKYYSNIKGE